MAPRLRSLVAAALVAASLGVPVTVGARQGVGRSTPALAPASAGTGGVAIDGSASSTRSATVTVTVPGPTSSANTLRLSNDGVTWAERPWSTSLDWSLIAPENGGTDEDGMKNVRVEGGPGDGTWSSVGQASILLDRTGPQHLSISTDSFDDRPVGAVYSDANDAGSGVLRSEISLDGLHYRQFLPDPWSFWPPHFIDLREVLIGGSWEPGERTIHIRSIDRAGNVGDPITATVQATVMRVGDDAPWTFRFPKPAVTNQLFTIEPVFDAGFSVPAGRTCQWRLRWGNDRVRLEGEYDETYGEVLFTVAPSAGKCTPWTFTLPYTPPREYTWSLSINSAPDVTDYISSGSFGADLGGTSRAIASSNLPLYYMLPDRDFVGLTGTVTYRLYPSGGAAAPTGGWWSCNPADHEPSNAGASQNGGASFDCPVTTSEPWVAIWGKFTSNRRWLVGYDPIGDRSKPVMSSLRVLPSPGTGLSPTSVTSRLTWAGRDSGSGLHSYTLQVSRNGGSWGTVTLPSARATTTTRTLALGATYRFRVRGRDRAGNLGNWLYSPTFRPTVSDEVSGAASWSSGWARLPLAGAYGGHTRRSITAGSTATFTFSSASVGVIAPRGPDAGFAQVFADAVLVGTVDLHAASPQAPSIVWSKAWASTRTHTIRIRVLGTIDHPAAAIDAFVTFR
jgi:hypothetical protein